MKLWIRWLFAGEHQSRPNPTNHILGGYYSTAAARGDTTGGGTVALKAKEAISYNIKRPCRAKGSDPPTIKKTMQFRVIQKRRFEKSHEYAETVLFLNIGNEVCCEVVSHQRCSNGMALWRALVCGTAEEQALSAVTIKA
ncbi:hypothetical protein NDU88_007064 [Pleurodeles waltl]|uniref:Uncharacterized protein n=1 Tax=Pleurodeles waltl TaxID=8319 RepID=A0AAV7N393_PLEWA|nr:hypothetical protein NDU88_007064 [Pleurodeles waltl]